MFVRTLRRLALVVLVSSAPMTAPLLAQTTTAGKTDAQPATKPAPDVLIFTNGDQLTGKLERADGGNVVFKSDMAGELTISFDKVKELRSGAEFALIRKGEKVDTADVQVGSIDLTDGKVAVSSSGATTPAGAPTAVSTKDVAYLVDKSTFDKSMAHHAGFTEGWKGTVTGGATIVRATQTANTYTADIALVREIPTVSFLPPRNRTTLDASESYGKQTSPVIPQTNPPSPSVVVLTSIFHADAERDEYFTPRVYALADTSFDHNFAQGLQLQQVYGAGIGMTIFQNARHELDVKADAHYEKQEFKATAPIIPANPNLIGSTFAETYRRNLPLKLVFTENGDYLPAWNDLTDYSANITATLAIPVFKRLSASVSTTDNYLNDPPAGGYLRNSYQFVTSVTYNLK